MEREKIIVTGVNGFVGNHLARELYDNGLSVVGVGQDAEISHDINNIVDEYHQVDLVNEWPNIPDAKAVIHLAGLANVAASFNKPQDYINANTSMITNMSEYYLKQDKKPRIVIVSSGNIYDPNQPMPIREDSKTGAFSPYAVSKLSNEAQAAYYRFRGLDCVTVRPFNHIGPGQIPGFLVPDLYEQIKSLQPGENIINTGNIETRRDYTDVRDIVKAYRKIATAAILRYDLYNICSGTSISGVEIFNELKNIMNAHDVNFQIDQTRVRPTDAKEIIGDASRLSEELGWQPEIAISQTLSDFVQSKS